MPLPDWSVPQKVEVFRDGQWCPSWAVYSLTSQVVLIDPSRKNLPNVIAAYERE